MACRHTIVSESRFGNGEPCEASGHAGCSVGRSPGTELRAFHSRAYKLISGVSVHELDMTLSLSVAVDLIAGVKTHFLVRSLGG